jgi:sulfur carrier protein
VNAIVNGEARTLPAAATVADVVCELHAGRAPAEIRGIAVAVDGEVVSRGAWTEVRLRDGARVEVLGAIGGGR